MLTKIKIKNISDSQKKALQNRVIFGLGLLFFWILLILASLFSSTNILERISSTQNSNSREILKIGQIVSSVFALLLLLPFILISYYEINKIYFDKISSITYVNKFEKSLCNLIRIKVIKNRKSYLILTFTLLLSFLTASISLIVRSSILTFTISDKTTEIQNDLSVILFLSMIVSFVIWLIACIALFKTFKVDNFKDIVTFLMITFITNAGFISLFYIAVNQGFAVLTFLFLIVAASDTFAYFGGMLFGRKKLSPKISKNKTVEGFVIGFIVSIVAGLFFSGLMQVLDNATFAKNDPLLINKNSLLDSIIFGMFSSKPLHTNPIIIDNPQVKTIVTFISIAVLATFISLASSFGDIFFSYIKRTHEIKDYSNILKDHGGILDRFDSILFSSTIYIGCFFIVLIFLQFMK